MTEKKMIVAGMALVAGLSAFTASAQVRLKGEGNIDEVISAMTVEEKVHMVLGTGMAGPDATFPGTAGSTYPIERLGIPAVYLADGPHQLWMNSRREFDSKTYYTTEYPTSLTLSATWNRELASKMGKGLGEEVRDYGLDVLLAPGLNLVRNPLGGRAHEYFSEDPVLGGKMAAAYVNGLQSTGAGACIKHFVANNQETNRTGNDAQVSERALRELYLKSFEIAVKEAQPWTLMTSYGIVNGTYTPESHFLCTEVLRDEWGYDGVVMSDWNAGKDAVASMKAGNNMMQPGQERQYKAILAAVKNGELSEDILDANVREVLRLVCRSLTFNGREITNAPDLKAHAADARVIGGEGAVLLQNDGVLPFAPSVKNVALYGIASYDIISGGMGFGGVNISPFTVSLVEGLRNGGYNVDKTVQKAYSAHIQAETRRIFPHGKPPFSLVPLQRPDELVLAAEPLAAAAGQNDVAIITLGRKMGEASDLMSRQFNLTEGERKMIEAVSEAYHAAGKKVVVILNLSCALETASWKGQADAVLCAFQGGEQIGNSITDVLSGKVNPSGKLPVTFAVNYGDAPADKNFPHDIEPVMDFSALFGMKENQEKKDPVRNVDYTVYEESIYVGYRYFDTFGKEVSFPFGFGLSYTTFGYEIISSAIDGDRCELKVKVTNTGKVAGKDVVQLYVSAPKGKLEKPTKELKAFGKTALLAPGESEVLTIGWNVMDMASFNEKTSAWELAKGTYQWHVCSSSAKVEATATQKIAKERTM
ncbi:MAG: glycoside hydrolase family 3 C-terminal domain-containing protein [Bacteroidales bacterium]|nr:glycoside hydrolase family 3 C-terminal domain-containing protein [Bacteroidales bacterium]